MHCQACGYENPAGSVYCQQCGSRIQSNDAPASPAVPPGAFGQSGATEQRCPRCGAANEPHVRFCVECGFAFASRSSAAGAPQPQSPVSASPHVVQGAAGVDSARRQPAVTHHDPTPMGAQLGAQSSPVAAQASPVAAQASPVAAQASAMGAPMAAQATPGGPLGAPLKSPGGAVSHPQGLEPAFPAGQPDPWAASPAPGANGHVGVGPEGPARLVAILKDGSDGRVYGLKVDVTDVGRTEGDVVLSDDPYLSPRHARILRRGERWILRDLDSVNGVYARIREPVELVDGDMLLIGQQVLRFETLSDGELPLGPATLRGVLAFGTPEVSRVARLVQYTTEGIGRDVHYLYRDETVIGRENGDIVFTDDPFLSRRHAAFTVDRAARRFVLRDLGSSNGTAIRFRGERVLEPGDQFRIGRHLFRFEHQGSPA